MAMLLSLSLSLSTSWPHPPRCHSKRSPQWRRRDVPSAAVFFSTPTSIFPPPFPLAAPALSPPSARPASTQSAAQKLLPNPRGGGGLAVAA